MKIGAHLSVAGGIENCLYKAKEIGADCVQLFASPPQSWQFSKLTDSRALEFKKLATSMQVGPFFLHATYLINLATDNQNHLKRSVEALVDDLSVAQKIDAEGVIFHLGSHKGRGAEGAFDQIVGSIVKALEKSKTTNVSLILENSAGAGGTLGASFVDLGKIILNTASDRVKICLDTQHSFSAGYAIHTFDGLEKTLAEIDKVMGIDKLVVVHANDSKVPFLTSRDRHENIGEGYIGREGFKIILSNPILQKLPFILETPGFDNLGPDKKNIEILRSLIKD